jgi:hypothetical protein
MKKHDMILDIKTGLQEVAIRVDVDIDIDLTLGVISYPLPINTN